MNQRVDLIRETIQLLEENDRLRKALEAYQWANHLHNDSEAVLFDQARVALEEKA